MKTLATSHRPEIEAYTLLSESGQKVERRKFETLGDFIKYVDIQNDKRPEGSKCHYLQDSNDPGFYGTRTHAEARSLLSHGWKAGRDKIANLEAQTDISGTFEESNQIEIINTPAGGMIELGEFFDGEPDCYREFEETPTEKPVIRIAIPIAAMATANQSDFENRGFANLALAKAIESTGRAVEITALACSETGKVHYMHEIVIKGSQEVMDIDRLSFICSHSAFFRQFIFGARDLDHVDKSYGWGTCNPVKEIQDEYDICPGYSLSDYKTRESAIQWIKDNAEKAGIKVAQEN